MTHGLTRTHRSDGSGMLTPWAFLDAIHFGLPVGEEADVDVMLGKLAEGGEGAVELSEIKRRLKVTLIFLNCGLVSLQVYVKRRMQRP